MHVAVVGGGLAGLCAAFELLQFSAIALSAGRGEPLPSGGIQVSLFEAEPKLGGNSFKASSGINGAGTNAQQVQSIDDTPELFFADTLASGHYANLSGPTATAGPELARVLVDSSADAVQWLLDQFPLDLSVLSQCGGHSKPRTHRPGRGPPAGVSIMSKMIESMTAWFAESAENASETDPAPPLKIRTEHRVTQLVTSEASGAITGVEYEVNGTRHTETFDAVVLSSGGYGGLAGGLLEEFRPDLLHVGTTNGHWARGEGVQMARAIGAGLVDMTQVQVHPTGLVNPKEPEARTKFLGPEALRGSGGILLNAEGKRFVNELGRRDDVTRTIWQESPESRSAFLLLDEEASTLFGANMKFYLFKGLATKFDSLAGVADALSVEETTLAATLEEYHAAQDPSGPGDVFGKTVFPVKFALDSPSFTLLTITPVVHYTMGGVRIDADGRVLKEDGEAIQGLFAAGEVSGGVHGGNRLAGNSLLECVVFGRRAGKNAGQFVLGNGDVGQE